MPNSKPLSLLLLLCGAFLLALAALSTAGQVQAAAPSAPPASPHAQTPQEGQQIFQQKCQACHTIGGGRLVGPDLQGVTRRREPEWLSAFIQAPDKLIASGDALALMLLADYNNLPMPNLGLSDAQTAALIVYLADPAAAAAPGAPVLLQGGDAATGEALFSGRQAFANRGLACIACHNVAGAAPLDGGSLGPDLTLVHTRYGATGLSGALVGMPFPSMTGVFANSPLTPAEQAHLYAYFQASAQNTTAAAPLAQGWFWLAGVIGALLLFALMAVALPRSRRSPLQRIRGLK